MKKYLQLAYKNLARRKIRSCLTVGGISVAVAVLVSLLGFNAGYRNALEKDISGLGYQVLITAKGCPYELATVALSGVGSLRYLTDDTIAKIKQDKDVSEVTATLLHPLARIDGEGFYTFWGIDRDSYTRLRPLVKIASSRHKEKILDEAGRETEREVNGPMGRWFNPRQVKPDEVYLKNGRVVLGLLVGMEEYEKVTGKVLDPISGEYIQTKKKFKTVKLMLPSRIYNKSEVAGITGIATLKEGKQVLEDQLTLKDGSKVIGIIINEEGDTYNVADVELAYPSTEEIDQDLIAQNPDGSLKIVDYDKPQDNVEPELVLGWEAAQTGFVQIGQKLNISVREMDAVNNYTFKVVGVLERNGSKDDGSYFIQLEEAQRIFRQYKRLTDVGVKLTDMAKLPVFTDRIYNRKELGETQVISLSEVKGTILNLVQTAKILIMSVAIIAIIVALIGVMNTILMSVFERTKEIGIMKAMGASRTDIFKVIWLETVIICSLGGLIGNLIAIFGGNFIEQLIRGVMQRTGYVPAGQIVQFSPQIIIGCFLGAICLGVLSGILPAYRACSMRPVEAIRLGE